MARSGHFDVRPQNDPRVRCLADGGALIVPASGSVSWAELQETKMKTLLSALIAGALVCGASGVVYAQTDSHVIASVNDAQWGTVSPLLPPGARIALLAGHRRRQGPDQDRLYVTPTEPHP